MLCGLCRRQALPTIALVDEVAEQHGVHADFDLMSRGIAETRGSVVDRESKPYRRWHVVAADLEGKACEGAGVERLWRVPLLRRRVERLIQIHADGRAEKCV